MTPNERLFNLLEERGLKQSDLVRGAELSQKRSLIGRSAVNLYTFYDGDEIAISKDGPLIMRSRAVPPPEDKA